MFKMRRKKLNKNRKEMLLPYFKNKISSFVGIKHSGKCT